jgi:hypothetical protein
MKKLYTVVLALFAVSALGSVVAASAPAETVLLPGESLANGVAITASLAVEVAGQALLEDTGSPGSAAVLCSAIFVGTVGPEGLGTMTEVLNLAKEAISLTPLTGLALIGNDLPGQDCETEKTCALGTDESPIEVWPIGLPITGELFVMENGELLGLATKTGGGVSGYELLCLVLGLNVVDECTATDAEGPVVNDPEGGDAAVLAGVRLTPNVSCTLGNSETGVNETDELVEIKLTSGELLTVDAM